jgi:hypothetical protein
LAAATIALAAACVPADTAEARGVRAPILPTVASLLNVPGLTSLADLAGFADTRLIPTSADVANVNGDRIVDLLVVNFASNNISVFIGRGHGKFAKAVRIGPRAIGPASLDTGDFNGGNAVDIVTANWVSNDVSFLLGNGDARACPRLPTHRRSHRDRHA